MHRIPLLFILSFSIPASAQIVLNEIQTANLDQWPDDDGDFPDWFELYNAGSVPQSLAGYAVSDRSDQPAQWPLPPVEMQPGEHLLVWASGKNRGNEPLYHATAIFPSDIWQYLVPASEPDPSWRLPGFDAAGWTEGPGGFGYADNDDGTVISPTTVVYARRAFDIEEPEEIASVILHMDYDDAFVAYLNGVEIARANLDNAGSPPPFAATASADHEATGYQGQPVDAFAMDPADWIGVLHEGENVLAIQVYNTSIFSSDLTGNAWLTFQLTGSANSFSPPPAWMGYSQMVIPHTSFALSTGETLVLSLNGVAVDQRVILSSSVGHSSGRSEDGGSTWCIFPIPTPDAPNASSACAPGYLPKPTFSATSGMYNTPVDLSLSVPVPGAVIRYTTDGSVPDDASPVYTEPFLLDTTAVISARTFSTDGWLPSPVEKNTYLVDESYLSVPVLSITTDPGNLWDEQTGIYVFGPPDYGGYPHFGANFWEDWEREAYLEYFDTTGLLRFEGPVGLKIHGGWSRAQPQKSFRIMCRDDYGMGEIAYPLIPDKAFIDRYRSFNLRNGGNEYGGTRYHDALMQRAMKPTDADYMAYAPVVAFLNGTYWGFYELRENLNEDYCESNHGVPADQATVISYNYMGFNVINGNADSFVELYETVMDTDPLSDAFYPAVSALLDFDNYMDYIIAETYYANGDWSNGWINNTKFWSDDRPGGKYRFMLMDLDFGLYAEPCSDYIQTAGDEWYYTDQIFARVIQNPQFRQRFILRYLDLVNTVFRTSNLSAIRESMREEAADAMVRHCARWGTDYWWWYFGYDWRLQWNDARQACMADVLQHHFALQNPISVTLDIQPPGAGRIHISSVEPESYPWTGTYFNGIPVQVTAIANPGFTFEGWAPNGLFPVEVNLPQLTLNLESDETFTAHFSGAPEASVPVVSEFMYNDGPEDTGDWIELHNPLEVPLDLSGMYIMDASPFNRYDIPLHTLLPAGGYLVLPADPGAFALVHPGVPYAEGGWTFGLGNNGDAIRLYNANDSLLADISYADQAPWPAGADGTGRSVEYQPENSDDPSDPLNWIAGCPGGSPGEAYDPSCGSVSVESAERASGILLYPNPAAESLWVQRAENLELDVVRMVDGSGRLVAEFSFGGSREIRIPVSSLSAGIYAVICTGTSGTHTQTFLRP